MHDDPHNTPSDAALVVRVARFDDDALAELYRRHGSVVYGLACRLLRDRPAAEDITQDVFVRLWEAPERFDATRGSLRAWLLAQTHSRGVDMLRSDAARQRREARQAPTRAVCGVGPDVEVVERAVGEQVRDALNELPAVQREAIELAYFAGCSYRHVAVLVGVAEGTVKSRIRFGLRRLRDDLTRRGVEPSWHTT